MKQEIPYKNIPYYSDLVIDYLDQKENLKYTYNRFPELANFKLQIEEKQKSFSQHSRDILVTALEEQYQQFAISEATRKNIRNLKDNNSFTITTGHQLNLFTGPLYFLYKIISVIKLTEKLQESYPDQNFIPVYWLASEDHDFEEINFFNFKGKQVQWKSKQSGAVGRFSTQGLKEVFKEFSSVLNTSDNADELKKMFEKAYLEHANLNDATRFLANELFGSYGLVIIDGDDKSLKREFIPYIKRELLDQSGYKNIQKTVNRLADQEYTIQVNPREINLFYLNEHSRDRIIREDNLYFLHETEKRFTENEILEEVKNHPENFSPNAVMRPLYQEVVLPNLAYIGGSGELAYWLELKQYFKSEEVVFPVLMLRNSALLITPLQDRKREKLGRSQLDLFLNPTDLINKQTKELSDISIDFHPQKEHLKQQFEALYELAQKTDKSFIGAVAAQEKKQLNGLNHLEKRLLKAQRRNLKDQLDRLRILQEALFPNENLQERELNFSELYEEYGKKLISFLFDKFDPLSLNFDIIILDFE